MVSRGGVRSKIVHYLLGVGILMVPDPQCFYAVIFEMVDNRTNRFINSSHFSLKAKNQMTAVYVRHPKIAKLFRYRQAKV